jgi:hypothetical protein
VFRTLLKVTLYGSTIIFYTTFRYVPIHFRNDIFRKVCSASDYIVWTNSWKVLPYSQARKRLCLSWHRERKLK